MRITGHQPLMDSLCTLDLSFISGMMKLLEEASLCKWGGLFTAIIAAAIDRSHRPRVRFFLRSVLDHGVTYSQDDIEITPGDGKQLNSG